MREQIETLKNHSDFLTHLVAGVEELPVEIPVFLFVLNGTASSLVNVPLFLYFRMKKLGGELEVADSQNQQPVQDGQVGAFINKGAKALIVNLVNPVDRAVAASLLEKARAANLPIVFLNREPDAEVMKSYDKACYVGTHAEESGRLLGELIVDYFKGHPEADRNGDGKIQYVMLRGGEGQQDAILRTE